MDKKTITPLLSVAIIASFFFPVFYWDSFEMSGLNYILSTHIPPHKYILLLAPASMFLLFFSSAYEEFSFPNQRMLAWIPLISLIIVFVMRFRTWSPATSSETVFSTIGAGFWLMLFFSLLLVFRRANQLDGYSLQR